jgi:hypothetical protein
MRYRQFLPIVRGGFGAIAGGVTGAAGAVILSVVSQQQVASNVISATMIGNGLIHSKYGSPSSLLSWCGFFQRNTSRTSQLLESSAYIGLQLVNGLLGCAIQQVLDSQAEGVSQNTLAALLIGAIIFEVPRWIVGRNLSQQVDALTHQCTNMFDKLDSLDEYEELEDEEANRLNVSVNR